MITIRIKGGLGNQLFQYAAAYALSKRLNTNLTMDISFFPRQSLREFKLHYLDIAAKEVDQTVLPVTIELYKSKYINKFLRMIDVRKLRCGRDWTYMLETIPDLVPEFFTVDRGNIYIDGYYQSEKYFADYRGDLLNQFQTLYETPDSVKELESELDVVNYKSVAVHVRRGDFLKAQHHNPSHYLLDTVYYHRALHYMEEMVAGPEFYWFSDDIEWVKQQFGQRKNFHYVSLKTQHPDVDELLVMSKCHHIITANSTFSWWAAWLNEFKDAVIVVPAKRYGNLKMIPECWTKIAVE